MFDCCRFRSLTLLIVCLVLAPATLVHCSTIYVTTTGSDGYSGLTWLLAKRTIPAALSAASAGDEVWVAKGVYPQTVTLKDGVGLYGGFFRFQADRSFRDLKANATVIDCRSPLSTAVTVPSGATAETRIDGFIIQGGSRGVYCKKSSVTIANNTITGTHSTHRGAGICCENSSAAITSNLITGNCSDEGGGGIYCYHSSVTITNSVIVSNKGRTGGGICCSDGTSGVIANNIVAANSAWANGGLSLDGSNVSVTNNSIVSNSALHTGGIGCSGQSSFAVVNNIIAFNSSGIHGSSESPGIPSLRNNCVYHNGEYDYLAVEPGVGDISVDPMLVSETYGDLHIQPTSPCRNAGWNEAPGLPTIDMDGQPRVEGASVDIGADESDGTLRTFSPAIIHVSPTGNDSYSGTSWAMPKKTLQAAVDALPGGGEVWAKTGVYNGEVDLKGFVYIYGGFSGQETLRSQRSGNGGVTAIEPSSNLPASLIVASECGYRVSRVDGFTIRFGSAYNGAGVYCEFGSPVISNNVITANTAADSGGGICCISSLPAIINNTIASNSAAEGGGIYADVEASPLIVNNIVAYNSSGVYRSSGLPGPVLRNNCVYANTWDDYSGIGPGVGDISADPRLASARYGNMHIQPDSPCRDAGDNSVVEAGCVDIDGQSRTLPADGNVDIGADESDGAVWDAPPKIIYVATYGSDLFNGSSWNAPKKSIRAAVNALGASGGEVWVMAGSYQESVSLRPYVYMYGGFSSADNDRSRRDLAANVSVLDGNQGGAVVTAPPGGGYLLSAIDGFTIRNAGDVFEGAGVHCRGSSPVISNNVISGNDGRWGGIYCYRGSALIRNNRIENNDGPGIYCKESSATVQANVLFGNYMPGIFLEASPCRVSGNVVTANAGGGICCSHTYGAAVTNNTVVSNAGAGLSYSDSSATTSNNLVAFNRVGVHTYSTREFARNCVYGNTAADYSECEPGPSDISVDPKLASVAYGNLHIQPDSPCRDAGSNEAPALPSVDMDGQARVEPLGGTVDIGADESDGSSWNITSKIVRVSPDGNDADDGSTWSRAKLTIQAAVNDLQSSHGGEIWVRSGVYHETIIPDRYIYLYGGFNGTEKERSDRDWRTNVTVMDGRKTQPVFGTLPGYLLNRIDGFTICNSSSAGVWVGYGSPIVANNVITGNLRSGIMCLLGSFAHIENNIITDNSGYTAGGIALDSCCGRISGNLIANNTASSYGGGITCSSYEGEAIITCNTIVGNTSPADGGAVYCGYSVSADISNNIMAFNSSGICRDALEQGGPGSLLLRNNCVWGNAGYDYRGLEKGRDDVGIDPLFRDLVGGDYHLRWNSPCINAGWNDSAGLPEFDIDGQGRICWGTVDIGADEYWPIKVQIDIRPGEYPNYINMRSGGNVAAAVLSTPEFNAATVDPASVKLAGASVAMRRNGPMASVEDVDNDGDLDLVLHFPVQDLSLRIESMEATLTGKIAGGDYIEGSDSVAIISAR